MLVVNTGHNGLILTEYNGKKYAFRKGIPVDISPVVYNNIIQSGFVNAQDIVPVEGNEEIVAEKPKVSAGEKPEKTDKKISKPVRMGRRKK